MVRFLRVALLLFFVHNAFGVADVPRSPSVEVNDVVSRLSARTTVCGNGCELRMDSIQLSYSPLYIAECRSDEFCCLDGYGGCECLDINNCSH